MQNISVKRKIRKFTFNKFNTQSLTSMLILLSLFVGICAGSIAANMLEINKLSELTGSISNIFANFNSSRIVRSEVFRESLLKYSKTIGLIWVAGFIWAGGFISLIIIGVKGAGIGFLTSLLVIEYGYTGMWYAGGLYLLQNIALIIACTFAANYSITLLVESMTVKAGGRYTKPKSPEQGLFERFVVLLICMFAVLSISFYEAYICPGVAAYMLGK